MKESSKSNFNNFFMSEALKQAQLAFNAGEIPVGAIIVNRVNQEIISSTHNIVEREKNPIFHAEIVAINQACQMLSSKNLLNCDIYVTLEPCSMCAAAIAYARISRLFYGASDPKQGAVENGIHFFTSDACFHRAEIYVGILAQSSEFLMKQFFSKIRAD